MPRETLEFGKDTAETMAGAMLDHFGLDATIEALRDCASFQERQAVGSASDQWTSTKHKLTDLLSWFRSRNFTHI